MFAICPPAIVYLATTVVAVLYMLVEKYKLSFILLNTLFSVAWAWILNFICLKGYLTASWILVLLPYMVTSLVFFFITRYVEKDLLDNVDKKLAKMEKNLENDPIYTTSKSTKRMKPTKPKYTKPRYNPNINPIFTTNY
jgi:hypothetical protein